MYMKNNFRILLFITFTIILIKNSASQNNFTVHSGVTFPVNEFSSDDFDDAKAGGAAIGANIGILYIIPLTKSGLGIFTSFDFHFNKLKKSIEEEFENIFEADGFENVKIYHQKYLNLPASFGLNVTHKENETLSFIFNAGLATNFFKATKMEIHYHGYEYSITQNLAKNVGFKLEGGILYKKVFISAKYYGLGTNYFEGEFKTKGLSEDFFGKQKVDIISITLGYNF